MPPPKRPKRKAYIFNLGESEFFISRTYAHYHILPCTKGMPYSITIIEDAEDRLDMGDEQYMWIPIAVEDIAHDIIVDGGLEVHGVGVATGPRPTQEEIDKVHAKRVAYYRKMLAEGDTSWAKHGRQELIDDNSRRAALFFGEQRPWAFEIVQRVACIGCGEKVPSVIGRHTCGAVVNIDQALAAGQIDANEAKRLRELRKRLGNAPTNTVNAPASPQAPAGGITAAEFTKGDDDYVDPAEAALAEVEKGA